MIGVIMNWRSNMETMYRYKEKLKRKIFHLSAELILEKYEVVKYTPKGKWIIHEFDKELDEEHKRYRFVLNNSRKRFAWETKEAALESFIARKKKQIKILESQLGFAEDALQKGIHMKHNNNRIKHGKKIHNNSTRQKTTKNDKSRKNL